MPTLYWLVDRQLHDATSRLESEGGVHRFEQLVDATALEKTHRDYERLRNEAIVNHDAPRPQGGVGGTRVGIKCLHAHLANYLVGHDDPVGELVAQQIGVPDVLVENVHE